MFSKNKYKLERPTKSYALDQCHLYKISGTRQLLNALVWRGTLAELEALVDREDNYLVFPEKKTQRLIQQPKPKLDKLQARIATLLRRIAPPEYRHSGVPGRSFLTNASQHLAPLPAVKIDVRKFYPSTSYLHVYRFFHRTLRCAADISGILAKICCYNGLHLPTGGRHSEVLAFYCHLRLFNKFHERAKERGGEMSSYIDDVTLTMPHASQGDLNWGRRLLVQNGLKLHTGKSRIYRARQRKVITGVVTRDGETIAPHKQHMKVREHFEQLNKLPTDSTEFSSHARSVLGHLDHIAQIDKRFKNRALGNRKRLGSTLRADLGHN